MLEGTTTVYQATWSVLELTTPSYNSSWGGEDQSVNSVGTSTWGARRLLPVISLGLFAVVGLPSNVAVIIDIVRKIMGQSASFTLKLMLTLAVCDLLSLLTIPVWMYVLLHSWSMGELACKVFTYLVYWTLYASVLTMTSMSVHHYSIMRTRSPNPKLLERLHMRRQRVWLVGLWVLAALLALPVMPTRSVVDKNGMLRCQRVVASDWQKVAGLLYEVLFGFAIPFCVLLCSYWCLHKKVPKANVKSKRKVTRLVVSIVVVFFVCWTPTQVINIVDMVTTFTRMSDPDKYKQIKTVRRVVGDFAKTLSFLNCCLDPFIYAFASKSFLSRCLCKAREESSHITKQLTEDSSRDVTVQISQESHF
ncbi:leukotriene B4 receptor 1-like [Engraulis encrasicolus]|uniref:leukotriene B4 receptor 1-like n=1 Tax=Engraulis encrasicolus TaxID=184585 RepID=UPI002FD7394C